MNNITDNELILLYYGEQDDPSLAARVAQSEELSARFDAICAELELLEEFRPPRRNEHYGAELWQRISPQLAAREASPSSRSGSWFSGLLRPRLSLAGAFSLVVVFAVAFVLGRQGYSPETAVGLPGAGDPATAMLNLDASQLLTRSVGDHLDQLNVTFTNFAMSSDDSADMTEHAMDLLVANRLYRRTAQARGERTLAALLEEIEPMLIELAYEAYKSAPETRDRMQTDIRDRLLFRIRVMNQQLNDSSIST